MKKINIISLTQEIKNKLKSQYKDPILCDQYAWWMLENITNKNKTLLISLNEINLTQTQLNTLDNWIKKQIIDKEPLQYLLGSVPFGNLEILVEPPILIPRPETEEMCYTIINNLKNLKNKKLTILDIGTGSGCIALTLAKHLEQATIYAVDISDKALDLAKKNAKHNNINNIIFLKSDLYKNLPKDIIFDIIVSNPPYIAQKEWIELDESVKKWEDPRALIAENNGLAIIEKIIKLAPKYLKTNPEIKNKKIPQLIIEIGYTQGLDTKKLFEATGFIDIIVQKDLESKDRFVSGRVDNVFEKKDKK